MREIKFRAWDKDSGQWYEPTFEAYRGNLFELLVSINGRMLVRQLAGNGINDVITGNMPGSRAWEDRFVLMQYTGLKDKNGVEIYEGDIIVTDKGKTGITHETYWEIFWGTDRDDSQMTGWLVRLLGVDELTRKTIYTFDKSICGGEVIGNIYENPELLK